MRNGRGFVCRPIFANDDLGDVEFIVSLISVFIRVVDSAQFNLQTNRYIS